MCLAGKRKMCLAGKRKNSEVETIITLVTRTQPSKARNLTPWKGGWAVKRNESRFLAVLPPSENLRICRPRFATNHPPVNGIDLAYSSDHADYQGSFGSLYPVSVAIFEKSQIFPDYPLDFLPIWEILGQER
jgi:hypothetical protein